MVRRMTSSFINLCFLLLLVIKSKEACHATIMDEDLTEEPTTTLATETTTIASTTVATTVRTPQSCVVEAIPFGTVVPPAGTIVREDALVGLTCDATHHASIIPSAQVCRDGVLSPTSLKCIANSCPDYMPLLNQGDAATTPATVFTPWTTTPTVPVPTPIGTTVTLTCDNPTNGGAIVAQFDNPRVQGCQDANNVPGSTGGDQITITCDPTGFWKVNELLVGDNQYLGIISKPGHLYCNGGPSDAPQCVPPAMITPY